MNKDIEVAKASVLVYSEPILDNAVKVIGLDHNKYPTHKDTGMTSLTIEDLIKSMYTTGFQATNLALAVDIINQMVYYMAF